MKHIKVELDFIPVEERLPKEHPDKRYLVLSLLTRPYGPTDMLDLTRTIEEATDIAIFDGGKFRPNEFASVSHWAEIPEIKARAGEAGT